MEVCSSSCADECCYEAFNLEICSVSTTHTHTQNAFFVEIAGLFRATQWKSQIYCLVAMENDLFISKTASHVLSPVLA